jgi:hypothetical protein
MPVYHRRERNRRNLVYLSNDWWETLRFALQTTVQDECTPTGKKLLALGKLKREAAIISVEAGPILGRLNRDPASGMPLWIAHQGDIRPELLSLYKVMDLNEFPEESVKREYIFFQKALSVKLRRVQKFDLPLQ